MIVASAIRFFYEDDTTYHFPQVWSGLRHADIYERMFTMGVKYDKKRLMEGFITDGNCFLHKYEAKQEAIRCRQLIKNTGEEALYSEDLWPED